MGACCEADRDKSVRGQLEKEKSSAKNTSRDMHRRTSVCSSTNHASTKRGKITLMKSNTDGHLLHSSGKSSKKLVNQRLSFEFIPDSFPFAFPDSQPTTRATLVRNMTKDVENASGLTVKKLLGPLEQKYSEVSVFSSGRFGSVILAEERSTHRHRVIKKLRKSKKLGKIDCSELVAEQQFRTEVLALCSLDHPHIVKVYELLEDRGWFYIVLEAMDGGDLLDYVTTNKDFSEVFAAKVGYQVLAAINYCHGRGIIHRGLSLDCLLLQSVPNGEDPVIKVSGFSTSALRSSRSKQYQSGSSYFLAPEAIKREYCEKSDVWSCGVILYMLLSGYPPFMGEFAADVYEQIVKKPPAFPQTQWKHISPSAIDLLQQMLAKDHKCRISASQCLNHPWIELFRTQVSITSEPSLKALENLRQFKASQVLKQTVLMFIAEVVEDSEETKALVQMFKALDSNGDGVLSRDELVTAYSQSMTYDSACYAVDSIIHSADIDSSGSIDYSEFLLAARSHRSVLSSRNLRLVFTHFDQDHSGKVSVEEIKDKVRTKNTTVSDALWDELIAQVDENGDGELDFAEFAQLMHLAVGK